MGSGTTERYRHGSCIFSTDYVCEVRCGEVRSRTWIWLPSWHLQPAVPVLFNSCCGCVIAL
jgi:hypothetical protein